MEITVDESKRIQRRIKELLPVTSPEFIRNGMGCQIQLDDRIIQVYDVDLHGVKL
jgi:hypothetical protein